MRVSTAALLLFAPACGAFVLPAARTTQQSSTIMAATRDEGASRRESFSSLLGFAAGALALNQVVLAADEGAAVSAAPDVGPAPAVFDLSKDYYKDAYQILQHMKYATYMNRDTPNYENIAKSVKSEMTDFVSYYRRFNNVAGKPSFSTLYTAINVMAGHYASYGPKFPIPEKRRKRLSQEFSEIERNIKRNR